LRIHQKTFSQPETTGTRISIKLAATLGLAQRNCNGTCWNAVPQKVRKDCYSKTTRSIAKSVAAIVNSTFFWRIYHLSSVLHRL